MQIRSNQVHAQSRATTDAARKVIEEFNDVGQLMQQSDNMDRIDLDSAKGEVRVDFIELGDKRKNACGYTEKYSGTASFNPDTREMNRLFVTKNYDRKDGVGVNYSFRQVDDHTLSYRRDDMYQEYPLSREIQQFTVDTRTNEIKGYEQYEERDEFMPLFGCGSDAFNIYGG